MLQRGRPRTPSPPPPLCRPGSLRFECRPGGPPAAIRTHTYLLRARASALNVCSAVELVHTDLLKALAMAAEWHEAPSHEVLCDLSNEGLNELVGVDATGWNILDLPAGKLEVIAFPENAAFNRDLPLLESLIEQHPLVPYVMASPGGPPITHSDVISRRQLERRQIYQDFFRPHEIKYQMVFVFSVDPFIAVAMNRRDRDFTRRQRELVTLLRPHLRSAYRTIAERARAARRMAALERGLEERGGG